MPRMRRVRSLSPGTVTGGARRQAPMLRPIIVRPADAVTWALDAPPVLDLRPPDFPDRPGETWPAEIRRSITAALADDFEAAFD